MKPLVALLLLCCSLLCLGLHGQPPPYARNATAYGASAALCPGCDAWADALEFLYYHNLVRLASLEPPLAWSPRLASYARWWAAQRRGDCALRHSFPDGQFALGENVFWGGGPGASWRPRDAVADWAAEGADYSYADNACAPGRECGHYTQIVWRRTTAVGCARVACDGGGVFITCNYYPPGNVVGERPYYTSIPGTDRAQLRVGHRLVSVMCKYSAAVFR